MPLPPERRIQLFYRSMKRCGLCWSAESAWRQAHEKLRTIEDEHSGVLYDRYRFDAASGRIDLPPFDPAPSREGHWAISDGVRFIQTTKNYVVIYQCGRLVVTKGRENEATFVNPGLFDLRGWWWALVSSSGKLDWLPKR